MYLLQSSYMDLTTIFLVRRRLMTMNPVELFEGV